MLIVGYGPGATRVSRAKAIALTVLALAVGGALLAFGMVLLLSLLAVGTVFGTAALVWNRLRGGRGSIAPAPPPRTEVRWQPDSANELPSHGATVRPLPRSDAEEPPTA